MHDRGVPAGPAGCFTNARPRACVLFCGVDFLKPGSLEILAEIGGAAQVAVAASR